MTSRRRESRVEQIITKMIVSAIKKSGNTVAYRGEPSKDFPDEWRTLMRVTGLFEDESDEGEAVDDKKEEE